MKTIKDIIIKFRGKTFSSNEEAVEWLESSFILLLDDIEKELPSSGQHNPLCHCQGDSNKNCNCGVFSRENYRQKVINIINSHR